VSGSAVEQGAAQKGEGSHLFAPMGFLDEGFFHRSYWVFGKNFAGGHNGYYQAGKYAPSGRMLVFDNDKVYGYGREPQYFKWTTTMEYQLFSTPRQVPDVEPQPEPTQRPAAGQRKAGKKAGQTAPRGPNVGFPMDEKLDPSGKAVTVEAWISPETGNGVLVAQGGPSNGFALALEDGEPVFHVRASGELGTATAKSPLSRGWHHVAGVLDTDRAMRLYVDGSLEGSATAPALISRRPAQSLQFGARSSVGDASRSSGYAGLLDEVVVYYRALSTEEIQARSRVADARSAKNAAVACSFNQNDANDESGTGINGMVTGVKFAEGKNGAALSFSKDAQSAPVVASGGSSDTKKETAASPSPAGGGNAGGGRGSFVQYDWTNHAAVVTRAMSMAGKEVVVAGAPSVLNEEDAFQKLMAKDPSIQQSLKDQDAALSGQRSSVVKVVGKGDGQIGRQFPLNTTPVWDGMAVARGRLYIVTTDGKIQCFGQPPKP